MTSQLQQLSAFGVLLSIAILMPVGSAFADSNKPLGPGAPPPGSGPIDYRGPVRVIEADTFEIYPHGNQTGIGVIGINAPPGNTVCGQLANQAAQQLFKGGLYLTEDTTISFDAKNRRMYYAITRDNKKVSAELVKAGLAHSSGQGKNKDELDADENDAKAKQKGCLHGPQGANWNTPLLAGAATAEVEGLPGKSRPETLAAVQTADASLAGGFSQQAVAAGFTAPTAFAFLPDGRILVAEKHGIVKIIKNGVVLSTPFLDLSSRVNDYWDHGLISLGVEAYSHSRMSLEEGAKRPASRSSF